MSTFARGKLALGLCDRCGLTYPLRELRAEKDTGHSRHNRVCPECFDPDHPQNFLYRVQTNDRISLKDPRPDSYVGSRGEFGWMPVGGPISMQSTAEVGTVTIITT